MERQERADPKLGAPALWGARDLQDDIVGTSKEAEWRCQRTLVWEPKSGSHYNKELRNEEERG